MELWAQRSPPAKGPGRLDRGSSRRRTSPPLRKTAEPRVQGLSVHTRTRPGLTPSSSINRSRALRSATLSAPRGMEATVRGRACHSSAAARVVLATNRAMAMSVLRGIGTDLRPAQRSRLE